MSFLDELKGSTAAVKLTFDGRGGTYGMSGSDTDHAGSEWVAHIYRATGGHLKFNGKGNPPDRKMGAVFPTDQAPTRASLGDLDKSKWPPSKFNQGEVEDPWIACIELPMTNRETGEECVFVARTRGSLAAAKDLLGQSKRLPEGYEPIVRLTVGSFKSKFGPIRKPILPIIGKAPMEQDDEGHPFDDEIPFK